MMFPNTQRDEFHRRPFQFDPGADPAVDEELLASGGQPVIQDPEIADPMEVAGKAGGPDPFRVRRRSEKVQLCCSDREPTRLDLSFL